MPDAGSSSPEAIGGVSSVRRVALAAVSICVLAAFLAASAIAQDSPTTPSEPEPTPETSPAPESEPAPSPEPDPESMLAPQSVGFGTGFTGEKYYCENTTVPPNNGNCFSEGLESYFYNAAIRFDPRPWNQGLRLCSFIDTNPAGSSDPDAPPGPDQRCGYDLVRLCLAGQSYPNCNDRDGYIAAPYVINQGQTRHQIRGHAAW